MKKIILSVLIAGATLMASDSTSVYKQGLLLPANGEVIYKRTCVMCHAQDGKQTKYTGSSKIEYAPINGLEAAALAKELKDYRYGSVNKYGYGALMKSTLIDLSYEEIDALAKYISDNIK